MVLCFLKISARWRNLKALAEGDYLDCAIAMYNLVFGDSEESLKLYIEDISSQLLKRFMPSTLPAECSTLNDILFEFDR